MDDDKCPYFDRDDGTCNVKWDGEIPEKSVVLLCLDKFIDCIHYENEQKNQQYGHTFCGIRKILQRLKSFLLDKNGDTHEQ